MKKELQENELKDLVLKIKEKKLALINSPVQKSIIPF